MTLPEPAQRDPTGRYPQPSPGPSGRPRCRWCHGEISKVSGRRTWCSQQCVDAYLAEKGWQHLRGAVRKRDRGVCALCGTDTVLQCRILMHVRRIEKRNGDYRWQQHGELKRLLGHDVHLKDQWQADHIIPRCEGGRNELDNLRTLCIPCHKAETARLAARRAADRRDAAAVLFTQGART